MQRQDISISLLAVPGSPPVRWRIAPDLVPYDVAVETMEKEAAAIADGEADELVWLVEHPPLYTAGTSANDADLMAPDRFPVFSTGRGGEYTYHGPGQRVVYVMLDQKRRRQDVRAFVAALEAVVIAVFGAVLGVVMGTGFGVALVRALESEGLTDLAVPATTLVVFVLVAGILGVLASLVPAWRAARLNVLTAVAAE